MIQYLQNLNKRKPVILTGDLNVGHLDIDIHNPTAKHISKQAGLTPQERASFSLLLQETKFLDAFRYYYPRKYNER
jgi:exonuclease III